MAEGSSRTQMTDAPTDTTTFADVSWDRESESTPVHAVTTAVASATAVDPLELPPLHHAIDAEALNALFAGPETTVDRLRFRYAGCDVVVRADGSVHVEPGRDD